MRILIAHEAASGGGGVESYLAAMMPAMVERGHQIAFLHHRKRAESGPTRLQFEGIPQFSVEDDGFEAVLARIAAWQPDACFSHNMGPLDVDTALLDRWPVVKMMHGFFGTCISSQKAHAFPSVVACTRVFGPACLALYVPRRCGPLRPAKALASLDWNQHQRRILDRYASIVVASRYMQDEYVKHGVPPDRVISVPLFPTTVNTAGPRPTPTDPTVLFAGRMTPLKGPQVLVHAVAEASRILGRPIKLVMAGEGPDRTRLVDLSRGIGVHATFPGWVSGAELTALFRNATLMAVPSLWPEPFGLVGLEAGLHGVPAVAFATGGIPEWLEEGVNGRLVHDRGDAVAMGRTLASVIADPDTLRRLESGALGVAARMTVARHLADLDAVFARIARV